MDKLAKTDHPIHELLARRWSPRAFADRPVEHESLRSLLEAARWAPSSFNEQPWAFLVATKDNSQEYDRMLGCLVEGNQRWARLAPVLMISLAKMNFERTGKPNRHAFHDVGQAAANLALQATALGLHVHQMAGIEVEKIRQVYSLPEGWEPVAGIAIGYLGEPSLLPDKMRQSETGPRSRKPIDSFVFASRFGEAASLLSEQK